VTFDLVAWNAALVLALMTALWAVSVVLKDASIVDPWWSIGFLLVAANTVARTGLTPAKVLLLAMVGAWAVRLWLYLLARSRGRAEDPRYAGFRRKYGADRYWWISFFQVFVLQGFLIVLISAPLQVAGSAGEPDPISLIDLLGLGLFAVGLAIEVVADAQLNAFRGARARGGPGAPRPVLDTGLWRYSRHPNYFGEAVLWWGFFLCALDEPMGWATVLAPLLMTFLLVKVSGVAMLDAHMAATRPEYAEYIRRTSAFVPRPPRTMPA
jgi:steroid 5-alpha reductase family enzyme